MNQQRYIFFACQYEQVIPVLQAHGLVANQDYELHGGGGANMIFDGVDGKRIVDVPKLLVVVGPIRGDDTASVDFATHVRAANPQARILFRENWGASSFAEDNPVFDKGINTDPETFEAELVEFLQLTPAA